MSKPTFNPYWIAFYFGQNIVSHPINGKYTLVGYFDGQVVCKRFIDTPDEECEIFSIDDIKLVLKEFHHSIRTRYIDFLPFLKNKAETGYWVFQNSGFKQIIITR